MSQLNTQYINYALQSLIVNTLEKDGAVCSFFAKNYDEKETYNGGTGFRKAFKTYNDTIIDYHTLLKVLTGEQRANIRESIPVIDFLNKGNTSLLYTYDVSEDGVLDTTTIRSASKEESTPLDLILNEDPFIINRALVGEPVAEHFYNSTGNASTPNIQTSSWSGNSSIEYLYSGILGGSFVVQGKSVSPSPLKISMYAFETPNPEESTLAGLDTGSSYIKFNSNVTSVEEDILVKLEKQGVKVFYTKTFPYIGETGEVKNTQEQVVYKQDYYTVADNIFLTKNATEETDYGYQIELNSEDICVLLPKTLLGGLATLLVFKKDSSVQTLGGVESITWNDYSITTISEDGTSSETKISGIASLSSISKGEVYHLSSYPEGAKAISSTSILSIPDHLQADADIIYIGETTETSSEIFSKANWRLLGSNYKVFYIPISSYVSSTSFEEIKTGDSIPSYLERTGVYDILKALVNIEKVYLSDASGLLNGLYSEPYRRDGKLVEDASAVPDISSSVTKWRFLDDVATASAKGAAIEVGSKYFGGHLLGRGYFDDEPLKLTDSDYTLEVPGVCRPSEGKTSLIREKDGSEYRGKVLLTYDILSNAVPSLFNKVKVENFNNFPIRSLDDVVTRADYDGRTYSASEAKSLLSESDYEKTIKNGSGKYESILNYPEKLTSLNTKEEGKKIADSEQILQYIEDLMGLLRDGETEGEYSLYLDLTNTSGPCVSRKTTYTTLTTTISVPNFYTDSCGNLKQDGYKPKEVSVTNSSQSITGGSSLSDIYTRLDKSFAVSYEVNTKGNSADDLLSNESEAFNFNIKMITPMEVFSTRNHYIKSEFVDVYNGSDPYRSTSKLASSDRLIPTGTILVYPEYSKYLPATLFLLSKTDLGLEEEDSIGDSPKRSMVSFIAKKDNNIPNSVISYKVTSVKSFKPSKITKVKLKTAENKYVDIDYKYGLYPKYQINAVETVTRFETKRVSLASKTITNSQGITFNFRDIIHGVYSLKNGNARISYNYGTVGDYTQDLEISETKTANLKTVNRLNALLNAVSGSSAKEKTLSSNDSQKTKSADIEIKTNSIVSRESSSTKNASEVNSLEKDIEATRNQTEPSYGIVGEDNAEIVRNYSYKKNSNVIVTPTSGVNTSAEQGSTSMGSSDIPSPTQSGFNTYHYSEANIEGIWEDYYNDDDRMVYVDVPIYSVTGYEYVPSASDVYDCYIYVLEPMTFDLDNITLYDQNDKRITFKDITSAEIVPLSYPSSFFAVNSYKNNSNQLIYQLKNREDVASLKDRIIIPGLPTFNSKEELLTTYTRGIPMEPIANMIYDKDSSSAQGISSILGNAIFSILKSWKLSGINETEGTVNPLTLEEFPSLVKGLVEAKPILNKLKGAGFTIDLEGSKYLITSTDVDSLINRITSEDTVYKRSYTITRDSSWDDTSWLDSIDVTTLSPDSESFDNYKKAFLEELKTRLSGINVSSSIPSQGSRRPSLKRISTELEKAFSSSNNLDENLCKTLDSFFGNDTKAFLSMGSSENTSISRGNGGSEDLSNYTLTASPTTLALGNKINTMFERIVLDLALEVAYKKNKDTLKAKISSIFNSYLEDNPSSIEWSKISEDKIESEVRKHSLKIKGYSSTSPSIFKKMLEGIKNNYRNYKNYLSSTLSWTSLSFDKWVRTYGLDFNESKITNYKSFREKALETTLSSYRSNYNLRKRILEDLRDMIVHQITSEIKGIYGEEQLPTLEQLNDYIVDKQSGEKYANSVFGLLNTSTDTDSSGFVGGHFCITEILPYYDPNSNTFKASSKFSEISSSYNPKTPYTSSEELTSNFSRQTFTLWSEPSSDVKTIVLRGIANYIKTALEGTGSDRYYVKYVRGDSKPSGRTNSLYYRRYLALNNRMNASNGTLAPIIPLYRNQSYLNNSSDYARNVSESYADQMQVVPVLRFSELTWMPPTKATGTSISIPGKFYYKRELETLREQIGDQCVLTCNKCNVQDSCPFYNPEEIIKLYCTPADTIDLFFKDNELDLIAYTEEEETDEEGNTAKKSYPDVWEISDDGESKSSIDVDQLKNIHSYYNDILNKIDGDTRKVEQFKGRDIQQVKEELTRYADICEFNPNVDGEDMGYLVGARYGTVRRNNTIVLANKDNSFSEFGKTPDNPLPTYQYLYDAVYIPDEETCFNYRTSDQKYDVSFEMGPAHNKKHYKGKTRIKIPSSLKVIEDASSEDSVYLISDDKYDTSGNPITPIIYLGKVGNLQWSIDIVEDPSRSIQSEYDSNVYASDIAQWCMNYYKGTCAGDPLGAVGDDFSQPTKPLEEDQDQYWMNTIKKKVTDAEGVESWITLDGRPRENTGYTEPLVDPNAVNEAKVACGKPVAANYINFVRKFSIRIYNGNYAGQYDEAGNYLDDSVWTIPWVNGIDSKGKKTLVNGESITWDTQRATLQFMKTNLRLVVVKNG